MIDYIQKAKHGDAIFKVLNVDNINRIIDVLVEIKGEGCTIEKPTDAEGRNWKIIVDGRRSDMPSGEADTGEEQEVDRKPLDYLIRFVGGNARESQYGDFAAQTDFYAQSAASAQWLHESMIPLGYCYLTFTPSGGSVTTSARADGLSNGFSLKAGRKSAGKLYRLAHGNQHAAMMMEGDENSIVVDCEHYQHGPSYVLRNWNEEDYITIPKSAFEASTSEYDFLTYDTYLPSGQRRIDHPSEIKFAALNRAFFEDMVYYVANYTIAKIDIYLCQLVMQYVFTHGEFTDYHGQCLTINYCAGTPEGDPAGGWIPLDDIPTADPDDLSDLLAAVQALYAQVNAWDIPGMIAQCDSLLGQISIIEASLNAYGQNLAAWDSALDAALASLISTAGELDGLDSVAASQEQRVAALKQSMGAT